MHSQEVTPESTNLKHPLFALSQHVLAEELSDKDVGTSEDEWSWLPQSGMSPTRFRIYASGGNFTSQQTFAGRTDHGEFQ
jgi:hypothetical protein